MQGISVFLLVIFVLFVVQAVGGYFQVKDYRRAVRRVHQLGNVGIGQKKGRFLSGNIVMIACDSSGIITGGEIMEGLSFLTKFKPITKILDKEMVGTSIYEHLDVFRGMDKKKENITKDISGHWKLWICGFRGRPFSIALEYIYRLTRLQKED